MFFSRECRLALIFSSGNIPAARFTTLEKIIEFRSHRPFRAGGRLPCLIVRKPGLSGGGVKTERLFKLIISCTNCSTRHRQITDEYQRASAHSNAPFDRA